MRDLVARWLPAIPKGRRDGCLAPCAILQAAVCPLPAVRRATGDCSAAGSEHGVREVARRFRRAASTVSRELRRNAAKRGGDLNYWAKTAK